MKYEVVQALETKVKELYPDWKQTGVELDQTDEKFGDYSCNIAMKMAKSQGLNPREIADKLAGAVNDAKLFFTADVAGPGFINIVIRDDAFISYINKSQEKLGIYSGQKVLVEYSDPNPFKPLHAGHLYTTLIGDSIARIVEYAGADVTRINYGGDVGLHVAKSIWAILKNLGGENVEKLQKLSVDSRAVWLGERYVEGNNAYEEEGPKQEITVLNKKIYEIHTKKDKTSDLAQIYWTCRSWSYDYFNSLYKELGVIEFDRYIPESEVTELGLETVKKQIKKGVYEESDGAVVFRGEDDGLHTRVFINAEGLPTYEAKEVGLILTKWQDYQYDKSIIITANEQEQYMQVVLASVGRFKAEPVERTNHLTHGVVKLAGGEKMSSRKGNILSAVDVIRSAEATSKKAFGNDNSGIAVGSIKYSFAKQRIGGDVIYDPIVSVNMHGDSGPYLQYALVRAKSILKKAGNNINSEAYTSENLDNYERSICRKMQYFESVVDSSACELAPNQICTYAFELAQVFNRFYENSPVLNNERTGIRISIVKKYTSILEQCLRLIGLDIVEGM